MFFQTHIFCCTNKRPDGHHRGSCIDRGGAPIRDYMKKRCKELGIEGTRVNAAGCLDRCELGPVVVIYPQGIWYRVESVEDAEEIIQQHLIGGTPVERLQLNDKQTA